jgi:hypothetical protein
MAGSRCSGRLSLGLGLREKRGDEGLILWSASLFVSPFARPGCVKGGGNEG